MRGWTQAYGTKKGAEEEEKWILIRHDCDNLFFIHINHRMNEVDETLPFFFSPAPAFFAPLSAVILTLFFRLIVDKLLRFFLAAADKFFCHFLPLSA